MSKTRVIIWGLGAMGGGMAKFLLDREGIEIVGAIKHRPVEGDPDLGKVLGLGKKLGVKVSNDVNKVLKTKADIVLHSTSSFTKDVFPELAKIMNSKKNVITIAEEMAYPQANEPALSKKIDALAKKNKVSVLGTGINPGFVLDTLIIALTGICANVKKIKAMRINDLSPFGPTVMRTQGVGTTVKEFYQGLKNGSIVGHIGFLESINMIADAIGWDLTEVKQTREPIITKVYRRTPHVEVQPGMVAGCKHIGYGMRGKEVLITLEHPQQICPGLEKIETGDYIKIEGTPNVNLSIKPEIPGGIGTMAIAINMIPAVIKASPGLKTMSDLPVPSVILKDINKLKRYK